MKSIMAMFGFSQPKKISEGDGSTSQDNNGNNSGNNGNNNQSQETQDGNQDDDSIFGNFVDADDADSDFDLGEDFFKKDDDDSGVDPSKKADTLDEEQNRILNEVHTTMKSEIERAVMADSEFQDFDPNDQSKIRKLLDTSMQRAAAAAVQAMMHPLKLSVEDAMNQMRREFQSSLQSNTVKSKAEQAFEPIGKSIMAGVKDKNMVAFAKQNFQMVLQRTKDYAKAQAATIQLLKTMGIQVDKAGRPARKFSQFGSDDSFESDSGNKNGIKVGNEALDSFFTPQQNRR